MTAIGKTFSEFFKNRFLSLDNGIRFRSSLLEMARPGAGEKGDVIRQPVNIDEDDIDFLQQFPHQYWGVAMQKRLDMLHGKLQELEEERMNMGYQSLKDAIQTAFQSNNFSNLSKWKGKDGISLKPEYIEEIKRTNYKKLSPSDLEDEADKLAYEYIKNMTYRIPGDNKPVDFNFTKKEVEYNVDRSKKKLLGTKVTGGAGRHASEINYTAKPFLNRLYHKLERTRGEAHDSSSGISGTGKYGFDLAKPQIDPHTGQKFTRGMRWPNQEKRNAITSRMNDFFVLNSNHMFGDLRSKEFEKKYPNAVWLPIHDGRGKRTADTQELESLSEKLYRKISSEIKANDLELTPEKRASADKREAEIRKRVALEKYKAIASGQIKAMEIPGHPELDRTYKLEGNPSPNEIDDQYLDNLKGDPIIYPSLYLPHEEKDVVKNGKTTKEWTPIVNAAHYFRGIGGEEWDYHHDEEGNRLSPEEHGYAVPKEMRRGPNKEYAYLHASPDPDDPNRPFYTKSRRGNIESGGHRASAALHFNHDDKGIVYLSPGDPGYEETYKQIFDVQKTIRDDYGNELYEDFWKGLRRCVTSSQCADKTAYEQGMLQDGTIANLIYSIVVQQALKRIGDPKLKTPKGRIDFAFNIVSSYVQTNLGNETRRKRILDSRMRNVSRDYNVDGKSISDNLDMASDKGSQQAISGIDATRKRGEKIRGITPSSSDPRSYSLEAIKSSIAQLKSKAAATDAANRAAFVKKSDVDSLDGLIKNSEALFDSIRNILIRIYQKKENPDQAEETADAWIKSAREDGATTSLALVQKLRNHPDIEGTIGKETPQEKEMTPTATSAGAMGTLSPTDKTRIIGAIQQTIEELERKKITGDQIKAVATPKQGESVSPLAKTIAGKLEGDEEEVAAFAKAIQDDLNNRYLKTPAASAEPVAKKAPASRTMTSAPPAQVVPAATGDVMDLLQKKDYVGLSHHSDFLKHLSPGAIATKRKLIKHFQENPEKYPQGHADSSIRNLKKAIGEE